MKGRQRVAAVFMLCFMILFTVSSFHLSAHATERVDEQRLGSVSVCVKDRGTGEVVPVQFVLYKVADMKTADIGVNYFVADSFRALNIDFSDIDAEKIYDYAVKNGVSQYKAGTVNEGRTTFSTLPVGVYLVAQQGTVEGYFPISPFIVSVPMQNADGTLTYDVVADSKPEVWKTTDITVSKVWNAKDKAKETPKSVSIQLLRGGKVIDTVVLNEANGWTHTWKDLPVSDVYSVKEINIPKGYFASYSNEGYNFTVTNSSSLVNTGQLMWPIPVLAILGILLMLSGWGCLQRANH